MCKVEGIALRMSTRWSPLNTTTTGVLLLLLEGDNALSASNARLLAIRLRGTCKAAAALAAVAKLPAGQQETGNVSSMAKVGKMVQQKVKHAATLSAGNATSNATSADTAMILQHDDNEAYSHAC